MRAVLVGKILEAAIAVSRELHRPPDAGGSRQRPARDLVSQTQQREFRQRIGGVFLPPEDRNIQEVEYRVRRLVQQNLDESADESILAPESGKQIGLGDKALDRGDQLIAVRDLRLAGAVPGIDLAVASFQR